MRAAIVLLALLVWAVPAEAQNVGKRVQFTPNAAAGSDFDAANEFSVCVDMPSQMRDGGIAWEGSVHAIASAAGACTWNIQYSNQRCQVADGSSGRWVNYSATDLSCEQTSNEQLTRFNGTFTSMRFKLATIAAGSVTAIWQGTR